MTDLGNYYLQRRTPAQARKPRKLEEALEILRCYYDLVRPHAALRFGRIVRTPAQQLGLFSRALSFREIYSWVPPPPRPALVLAARRLHGRVVYRLRRHWKDSHPRRRVRTARLHRAARGNVEGRAISFL